MRYFYVSWRPTTASAAPAAYDLVVYGATAGGVTTAVSGARSGLTVALLEPGAHVGGMASGGLQRTDVGRREVIGGMALELYVRAGLHYETMRMLHEVAWMMEAHVAERLFEDMLREAGVAVFKKHRLREKTGVKKEGARVAEIMMENGAQFRAKVFADASYEGDLMAQAGVSYTWGREGIDQFGESLAGVRTDTPLHQFVVKIPARVNGELLPEISPRPMGKHGSADKAVQAYNYRMVLSSDPANQVPFPKPRQYDAKRYELLARLIQALEVRTKRPLVVNDFFGIGPIPNKKADFNNSGAFSTDYIGKSWDYPEASYKRRAEIWEEHKEYTKGLFWFLTHDPRVPEVLRKDVASWGLSKDEFVDNEHWPHQLYVREARRMIGEYVMSQKDIQTERTKPDAIGMGSYNSDSHNVQRVVLADGSVFNEGDVQVAVQPYQIPYRMITPKRAEATNLLVPVCFSATHVAYSTLRMEPQYMIIGQAAGVAAKMAIEGGVAVQAIDAAKLTATLVGQDAILEYKADVQGRITGKLRSKLSPPRRRAQQF
ncbi:MAG: FAD-dependent oxidoreductase [Bryobacterales bacterium]|nr:FAD-dependent oxidoreductase [Bryobacterales bacterium]